MIGAENPTLVREQSDRSNFLNLLLLRPQHNPDDE